MEGPQKCDSCEEWTAGEEEIPSHLELLSEELPYCVGCLQIAFDDEEEEKREKDGNN